MASKMANTIHRAAFGNQCQIGSLYDCRNDIILSDMNVLGDDIVSQVHKTKNLSTKHNVMPIETASYKADLIGLDEQMKLSVLSGLRAVWGSAQILNENDEWYTKGKVGLSYEKIVATEELPERCFHNLDMSNIEELSDATHVVVGIEYGAKACMVFSEGQQGKSDVSLMNMVQLIPNVDPDDHDDMGKVMQNISYLKSVECKVFTDDNISQVPSKFIDALEYYHDWQKNDHGVNIIPIHLKLYPLFQLNKGARKVENDLKTETIKTVEAVLEALIKINSECNSLLSKVHASKIFTSFETRIQQFQKSVSSFSSKFKADVADIVKQIREGTADDPELIKLSKKWENSPFSAASLRAWFDKETKRVDFTSYWLSQLDSVQLCRSEKEKRHILWRDDIKTIIIYTFLCPASDDQLLTMKGYNQGHEIADTLPYDSKAITEQDAWKIKTMHLCKSFHTFFEINKSVKDAAFVIWEEPHKHPYEATKVQVFEDSVCVEPDFTPISSPGKPESTPVQPESLLLCWTPPVGKVSSYEIHYEEQVSKAANTTLVTTEECKGYTLSGLPENATYNIKVRGQTIGGLFGPYSESTTCTTGNPKTTEKKADDGRLLNSTQMGACSGTSTNPDQEDKKRDLKEYLKTECSTKIQDTTSKKDIHKLDLEEVYSNDESELKHFTLGTFNHKVQKVIMMVGATGSGKTTLINGLINSLFGVKWEDSFRFKLITEEKSEGNQAKSQTRGVTAYTLYHQEGFDFPYTLTLVDTPGFGDTEGIRRDQEITKQIKTFFSTNGAGGIPHLDGVGFVVNSSLPRLTLSQNYIINNVLALFGKNISDKIMMLLTFADGKEPQVLSALQAADIQYNGFLKYNNSALYSGGSDEDEEEEFNSMFWKMGARSYKKLLVHLNSTKPTSLVLTNQVLEEREKLACAVEGIRNDIRRGLSTLERLKNEIEVVKTHEAEIEQNKNFVYTVHEDRIVTEPVAHGLYITNCIICNRTCHDLCGIPDDHQKALCWAMKDEKCRVCPGKCHWKEHKNQPYKYVVERVSVTKRAVDLFEKYQKAGKMKLTAEGLVMKIFEDFEHVQGQVITSADEMRKSLARLKEIALKPDAMTTPDYIDTLIDAERQLHEIG